MFYFVFFSSSSDWLGDGCAGVPDAMRLLAAPITIVGLFLILGDAGMTSQVPACYICANNMDQDYRVCRLSLVSMRADLSLYFVFSPGLLSPSYLCHAAFLTMQELSDDELWATMEVSTESIVGRTASSSSSRHSSSSSSSSSHSYAPLGGGGAHSTATSSARPTASDRSGFHPQHRGHGGHGGAREDLTGFAFSFQQGLVSGAGGTTIGGAGVSVGAHSFTARSGSGAALDAGGLDFASDDDDDNNDDESDRHAGRVARRSGRSTSTTSNGNGNGNGAGNSFQMRRTSSPLNLRSSPQNFISGGGVAGAGLPAMSFSARLLAAQEQPQLPVPQPQPQSQSQQQQQPSSIAPPSESHSTAQPTRAKQSLADLRGKK